MRDRAMRMFNRAQRAIWTPTFVYQMGKVGSSSLLKTLGGCLKGEVVHAHVLHEMHPFQRRMLLTRRRLNLPLNVICPVREPLSRNVSAFFENFKRDTGRDFAERHWSTPELLGLFLRCYPHNVCLEWFDRHFRTVFGIDVFSRSFPKEKKWDIFRDGLTRALVYRADLPRAEQLVVLSRFLDVDIRQWQYANTSSEKVYGEAYEQFCQTAKLPDIYIRVMNSSSFARHFWTEKERRKHSARWSAEGAC